MNCISILQQCHPPVLGLFILLMSLKTMMGIVAMMDKMRAGELGAPQSLGELWAHNLLNGDTSSCSTGKVRRTRMYMMGRWALCHPFNSICIIFIQMSQ